MRRCHGDVLHFARDVWARHCTVPLVHAHALAGGCVPERSARRDRVDAQRAGSPQHGARDFDFLHGQWIVENRRLEDPFAPGARWIEFDSVRICRPLRGSAGHLEESVEDDSGPHTILRLFETPSGRWSVRSVSPANGALEPPLMGSFADDVGIFIGDRVRHGKPMLVRETWTRIADRPRCEQALSVDCGATWKMCRVMDFSRVDWPQ